jgi:hypothetical protein
MRVDVEAAEPVKRAVKKRKIASPIRPRSSSGSSSISANGRPSTQSDTSTRRADSDVITSGTWANGWPR